MGSHGHSQFGARLAAGLDQVERSMAGATRSVDDTAKAFRSVARSAGAFQDAARSVARMQAALDSFRMPTLEGSGVGGAAATGAGSLSAGLDDAAAKAESVGRQIGAALSASLAPLANIGNTIGAQMKAIGAVAVAAARQADATAKHPIKMKDLDELRKNLGEGIAKAAAAGAAGLAPVDERLLKIRKGALLAVTAFQGFSKAKFWLGGVFGGSASREIDRLAKTNFAAPVSGSARLGREFRTMAPAVGAVTGSVRRLGAQIALSLGVVGLVYKGTQALADFVSSGVRGASDLNETLSKTRETFGDATGEVTALADSLADRFGLVKGPMLDAASSIGLIARGAKLGEAASAKMATGLTRLAADASSFYNVPMDVALEKIRSGLVGESQPLREFGVLLNEEAVKAKAVAMGAVLVSGKLDEQSKVMARAALITEGLATASGDLSRTAGAPANAFRRFSGVVQNLAADFGTELMPVVQKGIGLLNELASTAAASFERNKGSFTGYIQAVVTGMDTAANLFRHWPQLLEIATLKVGEWAENTTRWVEVLMPNFQRFSRWLSDNWYKAIFDVLRGLNAAFMNFAANAGKALKAWWDFAHGDVDAFSKITWTPLLDGFKATADKLPELLRPALISMDKEIAGLWDEVGKRQSGFAAGLGGMIGGAVSAVGKALGAAPAGAAPAAKPKGDGEYRGTAALTFGSQEAASAIARFRNQGTGSADAAKTSAKENLKQTALQARMARALDGINTNLKQTSIDLFPIG